MDQPVWSDTQLPLVTVVVWAIGHLSRDPLAQRVAFAVLGAIGAAAAGAAVATVLGRRAGICSAALLATHPVMLEYGVVPYAEPLLLATLFPGLALWYAEGPSARHALAAVLLLAATTARYEAWWALAVTCLVPPARRRPRRALLVLSATFVLFWVATSGPVPAGGQSLRPGLGAERLRALALGLAGTAWSLSVPVAALAAWGLLAARRPPPAARRLLSSLALLLAVHVGLVALLETYTPPDNPRQVVLPAAIAIVFASSAADRLAAGLSRTGAALALAALVAWPGIHGVLRTRRQSIAPDPAAGHALGRFLEGSLGAEEIAVVAAPPRLDYPWLLPTALRFTRVNAPSVASRVLPDSAHAWQEAHRVRYVATLPGAPHPAIVPADVTLRPIPSPAPGVVLREVVRSPEVSTIGRPLGPP